MISATELRLHAGLGIQFHPAAAIITGTRNWNMRFCCDQLGIFCWTENVKATATRTNLGRRLTRSLRKWVKQNYNPSVPSPASGPSATKREEEVADREVPVVKALDSTRVFVIDSKHEMHQRGVPTASNALTPAGMAVPISLEISDPKGYVTETSALAVSQRSIVIMQMREPKWTATSPRNFSNSSPRRDFNSASVKTMARLAYSPGGACVT